MTETYESLRDSVENAEARAAWLEHDRRQAALVQSYRTLRGDNRYTETFKQEKAWEDYNREAPHIEAAGEKARALLEKEARGHEMFSMPRPKGENLTAMSPERLIAAQNEAARIVRRVERLRSADGPFKADTTATLREEYARGIEAGGVEGVAVCKGVLMAADELGVDHESLLNDLRTPEQLERLDKARRCRMMAQSISKRISEPPFERPRAEASERIGTYGMGGRKAFLPHQNPTYAKADRRPLWR